MDYFVNKKQIYIPKKCFSSGSEGKIYRIDNKIYKIYYKSKIRSITNSMLICHKDMTNIKTKQIVLPTALIYDINEIYSGYVNMFIEGDKHNKTGITKMPSNKFISNLEILKSDSTILGENLILMKDLNYDNYQYNSKSQTMFILDIGKYTREANLKKDDCITRNIVSLNTLITELLYEDFKTYMPLKTFFPNKKARCLISVIENKKNKFLFSDFFRNELANFENVYEYAKSLKK